MVADGTVGIDETVRNSPAAHHAAAPDTVQRTATTNTTQHISPTSSVSPASDFAVAFLRALAAAGVTDVVVSPGSRSQALALAAAALERAGVLRAHVRLDERTAGFVALGIAVETNRPAAVVTTSGTAVANLHPAVLEAHHSGVPMLVLSADRPDELRGLGSNQTTVQPGIFAAAVRRVLDVPAPSAEAMPDATALARAAVAAAAGHDGSGGPGPVQVNLAFREPLSAGLGTLDPAPTADADLAFATRRVQEPAAAEQIRVDVEPGTIVIAGHDAGPDAERVAWELGAPLIAEVSSGAHFGRNLVVAYRQLLAEPGFGDAVHRAVVFGHPTLSREVPALLQRADVEAIVVRGYAPEAYDPGRAADPGRGARIVDALTVAGVPTRQHRAWVGRWVAGSRAILGDGDAAPDLAAKRSPDRAERNRFLRDEVAVQRRAVDRSLLVDAVWGATWPHDRLVVGASQLIRVADGRVPGKRISVHANRGLAGIDGTISTGLGVATGLAAADTLGGTTRVLVGDLAFIHDLGALVIGTEEPPFRLQVIVGNDRGGAIFRGLEVARTTDPADMLRMMETPQHIDIERVVSGLGWEYRLASTWGDLERVLTDPADRMVIEVPLAE